MVLGRCGKAIKCSAVLEIWHNPHIFIETIEVIAKQIQITLKMIFYKIPTLIVIIRLVISALSFERGVRMFDASANLNI